MHLLFVCTGNTCRSPLAEGLARREAAARGLDWLRVGSAGTGAWPDAPASDGSMLVAMEQGLDLSEHRARTLSAELVQNADVVLTMGEHHLERVFALGGEGRAHLVTDFASRGYDLSGVSDPFGGDLDAYRATFTALASLVHDTVARLVAERAAGA